SVRIIAECAFGLNRNRCSGHTEMAVRNAPKYAISFILKKSGRIFLPEKLYKPNKIKLYYFLGGLLVRYLPEGLSVPFLVGQIGC
ncbi:hypothetical protein C1O24_19580, partial [Vibrio diazotrophicus]